MKIEAGYALPYDDGPRLRYVGVCDDVTDEDPAGIRIYATEEEAKQAMLENGWTCQPVRTVIADNGERVSKNEPLFSLGNLLATPGALALVDDVTDFQAAVLRHQCGDFGDVPTEDWQANEKALEDGGRILSSYKINRQTVWIITEADRAATTILRPSEY